MTGAGVLINRFARAVTTYESQAIVQRSAAEYLAERLGVHFHTLAPRILEIGCGTGFLTRKLMARFSPSELVLNDLCPDMGICFSNLPRTKFIPGDACAIAWDGQYDAIASSSAVQWFSDLNAFVRRCAEALHPQGLLAISGFGPQNLREIKALTGHGLTYPDFDTFVSAFATDFVPLETAHRTEVLHFADASAVLRHLKETGVTATGATAQPWTRARMEALSEAYAAQFPSPEGGVTLTYEPFWFVGRKR